MNTTNDTEPTTLPTENTQTELKQKLSRWGNILFTCFTFMFLWYQVSSLSDVIVKLVYVAEPSEPGEPRTFNWERFWVEVAINFAVYASALCLSQALVHLIKYMRRPSVVDEDTFEDEKLLEKGLN